MLIKGKNSVFNCMFMCGSMHMNAGAQRDQKRASDTRDLKLQVASSRQMWVLKSKLLSSAKASGALNHQAISPTPERDKF